MTVFYSDTFANAVVANTIDLSQQRLYAVLLENPPLRSFATRSQLDEVDDANYQRQPVSHTWASNQLTVTDNPIFPQHATNETANHVALCYRSGASQAATDMFCWASSLRELSQIISAPVSLQSAPLQVRFPTTPIINFAATAPVFPGGTHSTPLENTTQGIIARMGTNNYTTGTYTNPVNAGSTAATKIRQHSGSVSFTSPTGIGLRTLANTGSPAFVSGNNAVLVLDFFGGDGSLLRNILASRIAFSCNTNAGGTANLQVSVGSSLPALTAANFSIDAYFTTIGTLALPTTTGLTTQLLDTTASSFERFIRLKYQIISGTPSHSFSLLDLFDPSRLQSPNTSL